MARCYRCPADLADYSFAIDAQSVRPITARSSAHINGRLNGCVVIRHAKKYKIRAPPKKQSSAHALLLPFAFRKPCLLGVVDGMSLEPVRIPRRTHISGGALHHARREVAGLPGESREESDGAADGPQGNGLRNAPTATRRQTLQQAGTRTDGRQSEGGTRLLGQD